MAPREPMADTVLIQPGQLPAMSGLCPLPPRAPTQWAARKRSCARLLPGGPETLSESTPHSDVPVQ